MAKKIAITNMKGGIGKTTTALCLTDALKKRGYKVLLIDTDPQRSATGVFQAQMEDAATLADILYEHEDANECIQTTRLGDIIASDALLSEAETSIKADADRFYHLKDACESIESKYDFIIVDCPPGNGVLLGNVLCYVDTTIVPVTADKFGIQGIVELSNQVMAQYKKRINPNLDIQGLLIIKYKGRQSLTKDIEDGILPDLAQQMGTKIFNQRIRESVKCQEAQAVNQSLFEYAPKSTTALDYEAFTDELLKEVL